MRAPPKVDRGVAIPSGSPGPDSEAIFVLVDGRIVAADDTAVAMVGVAGAELLGRELHEQSRPSRSSGPTLGSTQRHQVDRPKLKSWRCVHALKIDQSFVARIDHNPHDAAITRSIISLAKELDMIVVAEGVETIAQHSALQALGCSIGQGFLYGKPGPVATVPVERAHRIGRTITRTIP